MNIKKFYEIYINVTFYEMYQCKAMLCKRIHCQMKKYFNNYEY